MHGLVWDVVRDRVDLGEAGEVTREYVRHPGAVAVAALDDQGRLCLIQQYRHPVRAFEWEIPAGLLDVTAGAAARGRRPRAARGGRPRAPRTWHVLADYVSSPGGLDEALRIYLARDLSPGGPGRPPRRATARSSVCRCAGSPLEEARDAVLAGRVHNATVAIAAPRRARGPGPGLGHAAGARRPVAQPPGIPGLVRQAQRNT